MFESSETSEAGAFSTSDVLDAIAALHKENNERRDKNQDLVQAIMTGNKSEMAGLMMELIDKKLQSWLEKTAIKLRRLQSS